MLISFQGKIISPPDFLSDVITALPLLLLFEISLIFSKGVYQKKLKKKRRNYLKIKRKQSSKKIEKNEGIQYQSGIGIEEDIKKNLKRKK